MSAATKAPPISLLFKPSTPSRVLKDIREKYEPFLEEDPLEDYFETEISKKTQARMTPGVWIRSGRDAYGWTQARLASEIGGISAKRISDWESGRRAVSKEMAKKLAAIFLVPAEKF